MTHRFKRVTTLGLAVAALAIPVAVSSAGTPSTVKVPLEHNNACNNFTGKHSPAGTVTFTRLKNGDIQMLVRDRNPQTPGTTIILYPWTFDTGSCRYYYFTPQPTFKLDSSGVGTKTFTFTPDPGATDVGTEAYNNASTYYDVTPASHI